MPACSPVLPYAPITATIFDMGKMPIRRLNGKSGAILIVIAALAFLSSVFWLNLFSFDGDDPQVNLKPPEEVVGSKTVFTLEASDQGSGLKEAAATITQGEVKKVLLQHTFAKTEPGYSHGSKAELPFTLEPKALGLKEGKATIMASARDRSWRNWLRGRTASLSREVVIDLVPLNLTFLSVNHLLHSGGTGLIRYRLSKAARESGITVGGLFFAGFPQPRGATGEYIVLFLVPRDAGGTIQAQLVARPEMGQEAQQQVSLKVKPRRWRHDRLNLSDNFLRKVAADFPNAAPGNPLNAFLEVNRNLRRANHARIKEVCRSSRPQPQWSGGFLRYLGKPMARFGDHRSYIYQNREVDRQTHLGEDLASLIHSPVPSANNGMVVMAEPLGIYGQTVIVDHGLGVFSQYSHLSKMEVKVGQEVKKGAVVGLTGTTGLAGGDHLHFSMLLQGEFVDPLEWWDPHWLKDQVEGQYAQAVAPAAKAAPAAKTKPKKGKGKARKNR